MSAADHLPADRATLDVRLRIDADALIAMGVSADDAAELITQGLMTEWTAGGLSPDVRAAVLLGIGAAEPADLLDVLDDLRALDEATATAVLRFWLSVNPARRRELLDAAGADDDA